MPEDPRLTPAATEDVEQTLAFALRFDGRKRAHSGDELMARITAERLVKHLERSGFMVMRKPPSGDLSPLQGGATAKP
jgi:Holliday junction resolvase